MNFVYDQSGNLTAQTAEELVAPQIIRGPLTQVASLGEALTFSVLLRNAQAVSYQWNFNGTDILGATADSLVLASVGPPDQGQYSVVVTNGAGSVTSDSATLLLDADGDGLPDSWEVANFGDTTSQSSEGDPDKDGVSNLDEFLDGTNPNSNLSFRPRLTA